MVEKSALDYLYRERDDITPLVVMMCGITGSGKPHSLKSYKKAGFVRLSIDEEVWSTLAFK